MNVDKIAEFNCKIRLQLQHKTLTATTTTTKASIHIKEQKLKN